MNFRKLLAPFIILTLVVVLTACGDATESEVESEDNIDKSDGGTITIGQINWPENIAVTNMWKAILEEEGYDVELILVEMGPQMASLAKGDDLDVAPEIWLPIQDKSYHDKYKDETDFSDEPWYDNGIVGLAVPEYMDDINSIEDLNANKDLFNSEIIGFEPGAGTMLVTEDVIEDYDLEYELVPSSEAAMIVSIREAIENNEPIVAPLWKPHFIFSEVDMKFLEDPQETYGGTEEIFMATRTGFDTDYEVVHTWLNNWKLTDDELGDLMIQVKEHEESPLEGAREWIEENRKVVESWMK